MLLATKMLSFQFHPMTNSRNSTCMSIPSCNYGHIRTCSPLHHPAAGFVSPLAVSAAAVSKGDAGVEARKGSDVYLHELGLKPEAMPKHVAIIMDGNRRWARNRMLPNGFGHLAGKDTMKQLAILCSKLGIPVLTVFAFSTENWTRTDEEVDFLMSLFEKVLASDFQDLIMRYDMQVSVIGERSALPRSLQSAISEAEVLCKQNKGMKFVLAVNYSGLYDVTEASKKIATKVKDGAVQVEDINEAFFKQHLATRGLEYPDADLLIRTSGELRLSNFMLCQLAYSELLFVDKLFPDFKEADLVEALKEFQRRQRRFGGHTYSQT